MDVRRGVTRIGVLTVAIVVVTGVLGLTSILMVLRVAGTRKRETVMAIRCRARLVHGWGKIFAMYMNDNDGRFFNGEGRDDGHWWMEPLRPYFEDDKLWPCPLAATPYTEGGRNPFGAWKIDNDVGSYGLNGWICNPPPGKTDLWGRGPAENYWGTDGFAGANNVPLILDCMWFEGWPRHTDEPAPDEDWLGNRVDQDTMKPNQNEMRRFCVNRHQGCVNVLFMDWSVRRVGLKELWTLKWHRNYDVNGPWTRAGGIQPMGWPGWMRNLKDY